jgi:DNA-binding CsgD family transcriptional regulator
VIDISIDQPYSQKRQYLELENSQQLLFTLQKNGMNFKTKISDLLYRRQRLLEIVAVFLIFSVVAFRFDGKNVKLIWRDSPFIALTIVLVIVLIAIVWIRIEKKKMNSFIEEIKNKSSGKNLIMEKKLNTLSNRQREVFDHIIQGKSNKDIITTLNIELSTLKTHINQIYKVLEIKSRKEAQSVGKMIRKGD